MAKEFAKPFYNSKEWQRCRAAYIAHRRSVDGGMCESCHRKPGYIVHHKTELTPENINDPNITLGFGNLKYDCHDCHNIEHMKKSDEPEGLSKIFSMRRAKFSASPPQIEIIFRKIRPLAYLKKTHRSRTRGGCGMTNMENEYEKSDYLEKSEKIKKEERRLKRLFSKVDADKKKLVNATISDVAFLTVTMEYLREAINRDGTTIEYKNGENQYGTKQSPDAQLYLQMSQKQTAAMKILMDCLPKTEKPLTQDDGFDDFLRTRDG